MSPSFPVQRDPRRRAICGAIMIKVNDEISIRDDEILEKFIRSDGPGGQNVNKVSTAVQLRFDALRSPSLPPDVGKRLAHLAGSRLTQDGEVVITARRHRTREANRKDALARLVDLIAKAAVSPRKRVPTRPNRATVRHRLEDKAKRAQVKRLRRVDPEE